MRRFLTSLIASVTFFAMPALDASAAPSSANCAASTSTADISAYFASNGALLHGDYQRSLQLPDGRTLWTFQDAFVNKGGRPTLIHNAGLVQTGSCFQLLRGGTQRAPKAWLLAESTQTFHHWFWPLASSIASDGTIRIFMAEMREVGDHYLSHVEPQATWVVTVRQSDLAVVDAHLAADPTPSLYGWSITSDRQWTYLYGYCYRQFGFDPLAFSTVRAHDLGCSADVRVARVRRGHLDDRPTYWNGTSWIADATAAVAVLPRDGRSINPAQVRWTGRQFVAVTKVGDWFGDTIYVDTAPAATGPWTTVSTLPTAPLCAGCNTYFASLVAGSGNPATLTIGISNNTWDGQVSGWYHPALISIPMPAALSPAPHPPTT
jgi:hypothetical protein